MGEWWLIPSITVAVIAAGALVFKVGRWTEAVNSDRSQFREFMVTMREEFSAFRKEMRDEFHLHLGEIRKDIRDIRGDIKDIRGDSAKDREFSQRISQDVEGIKTVLGQLPSTAISDNSPLHLTDMGESISATLQARKWAERTAAALGERVKGKRPYEIQDLSFEYVKNEFKPTEEQEVEIRTCAYEKGVKRDIVLDVLAVELRDVLLKAA